MHMQSLTKEERALYYAEEQNENGAKWPQYDDRPQPNSEQQQKLKQLYEADTYFEYTDYKGDLHTGHHESYCYDYFGNAIKWRNGVSIAKCAHCGQEYYIKVVGGRRIIKKYCSDRCANDAYIVRRRQRQHDARRKICAVCGKVFDAKRKDAIYCSNACRQAHYRNVTNTRYADNGTTDNCN